jgi:putative Mn2+ efflux pump MntP
VATSIDALAVGLTLAVVGVSVWVPAVVIGLVAGLLTVVGIRFGDRIGSRLERWAGAAGGLVLIAIGVRILLVGLLWEG